MAPVVPPTAAPIAAPFLAPLRELLLTIAPMAAPPAAPPTAPPTTPTLSRAARSARAVQSEADWAWTGVARTRAMPSPAMVSRFRFRLRFNICDLWSGLESKLPVIRRCRCLARQLLRLGCVHRFPKLLAGVQAWPRRPCRPAGPLPRRCTSARCRRCGSHRRSGLWPEFARRDPARARSGSALNLSRVPCGPRGRSRP